EGYAVIDPVIKLTVGEVLLILSDGYTQFARLQGRALITSDGEAIRKRLNNCTFSLESFLSDP
ncbi:hypothetical protein ACUODJ_37720, partial [Escherichia sp. HC-CC]